MTPAMIGEKDERMVNGYALMAVENSKDVIIGMEILAAEPSLQSMGRQIPEALAKQMSNAGFLPEALEVCSTLPADLLDPFAEADDCERAYQRHAAESGSGKKS